VFVLAFIAVVAWHCHFFTFSAPQNETVFIIMGATTDNPSPSSPVGNPVSSTDDVGAASTSNELGVFLGNLLHVRVKDD
jgi:hypothetical protein